MQCVDGRLTVYRASSPTPTSQIKRAQTVKSHYLHSQQHILEQKKQEAEVKADAPGGIMGLNLIALKEDDSAPVAPKEEKKVAS